MNRMRLIYSHGARWGVGALAVVLTVFLALPAPVSAQLPLPLPGGTGSTDVTGATGAVATVLGTTTTLASTGTLTSPYDALAAELDTATLPVGTMEVVHAATVGSGDYVSSESSLANLALAGGGNTVSAAFAMATALATTSGATVGSSEVSGLVVNGVSIVPTGAVNQTVVVGAITVVLNEVTQSASGISVTALHISTTDGLVDLVLASASAAIP